LIKASISRKPNQKHGSLRYSLMRCLSSMSESDQRR